MSLQVIVGSRGDDGAAGSLTVKRRRTAFEALPDEIIEQIMCLTDPGAFASLVLLNRAWRIVSQQAHLYAHHLSHCSSYAAAHNGIPIPANDDSLPQLKRLFLREIKRNLFDAYLRPAETIITLVSTSIGATSAPGGDAFQFSLSPQGRYILAYSSSRIHIIDVSTAEIQVKRELKILRRPALTTISDDGSTLAVLSTDLQIDLYDLSKEHPKHSRVIVLDYTPRTIALSPTGCVLAAAYDSGVEVSSLDPRFKASDKRAVKCYAVDSLTFSRNGSQLLGTTLNSSNPSTVVLSAPYYNPASPLPEENVSALWTTSILFPNGSRDCSHAVLIPSVAEEEAIWTFTYDRVFETFRAVRIDDLRNGTTYFTGPTADPPSKLLPSTLPAASASGDLVAAGFPDSVWVYGVPEDLDAVPTTTNLGLNSNNDSEVSTPSSQLGHRSSIRSTNSASRSMESKSRTPQWQLLCDNSRNNFVEGRKICSLDGATAMNWVGGISRSLHHERLVVVAPGVGTTVLLNDGEGMSPLDGGRIAILDFAYTVSNGQKMVVTIEVGANEPEVLEEEHRDLDTEVALVRQRTVAQRRGFPSSIPTSATSLGLVTQAVTPFTLPSSDPMEPFTRQRPIGRLANQQRTSTDQSQAATIDEQEIFDAPYSHSSPRSAPILRRAATAAAVNRRLHPQALAQGHVEYRRADGREEHPHESDADNWIPPPPPYTKDPVSPLPEHIQRSILAEAARATSSSVEPQRAPDIDTPRFDLETSSQPHAIASSSVDSHPFLATLSDSRTRSGTGIMVNEDLSRPVTSPITSTFDDLYDVSPPGSPRLTAQGHGVNQITRRPVSLTLIGGLPSTNYSPGLSMRATLQQPTSPMPHPTFATFHDQMDDPGSKGLIRHESGSPTIDTNSARSPVLPLQDILVKEVPQRPNEDHHVTKLPPSTPESHHLRDSTESLPPLRQSKRSETTPAMFDQLESQDEQQPTWRRSNIASATLGLPAISPVSPLSPGFAMPSSDQIARLNNRKSRPPSQILNDPSRRTSAAYPRNRNSFSGPSASHDLPSSHFNDQTFRPTRPRAGVQARTTQPRARSSYIIAKDSQPLPPRPSSSGHLRRVSQSNPNIRPSLQRLDTIHSMGSTGEPSPFFAPKPMTFGPQQRKSHWSASSSVHDAKKKGWMANLMNHKDGVKAMEQERQRGGDSASSAGWTEVSRESESASGGRELTEKEKKHGGKCKVM